MLACCQFVGTEMRCLAERESWPTVGSLAARSNLGDWSSTERRLIAIEIRKRTVRCRPPNCRGGNAPALS